MRHLRKYLKRHKIIAIALPLAIIASALTIAFLYKKQVPTPSASTQQSLVTNISVDYCSQGDAATACDPNQNKYSEHANATTSVTVTVPDPAVATFCIQAESDAPLQAPLRGVVTVKNASGAVLLRKTNQSSNGQGRIVIPITPNEAWTSPSTVTFKADGYFAKTVTSNSASATDCVSYTGSNTLVRGDFDNDGSLTFNDIILVIKAYRGTNLEAVPAVFGDKRPTIDDIIEMIKKYRQRANFHDA